MPPKAPALDHRPSYLAAGIASLAVFLLYIATLAPSTAMWDASEYITAAYTFGLPHPPGNPFFVIVGRFFTLLPIGVGAAVKVNTLAALASAVSSGMWFLIVERVLSYWLPEKWQRITGAAVATLIGATVFTVWSQSVVNEKPYTVSLAFFAIVSWLTVLWCDDPDGPKADKILILIAYLIGLGYTNHPAGFLVTPAVGVAVLARRWQTIIRPKLVAGALLAMALGMTVFTLEPIRSAHFPAINEGEPTGCMTEFHWSCTFSATTEQRLKDNINRVQFGKPDLSNRQADFVQGQIGMWWHYFTWQFLRDPYVNNPGLQMALALIFLLLGLLGGVAHWQRDRMSFWFFGPLIFTVTLALIYYMNFKYGFSQSPDLGNTVPREVRDRDYFYLWSFSAWSVWAALGLVWLWEIVASLLSSDADVKSGSGNMPRFPLKSWLFASPILLFAFVPLIGNWKSAPRRGDTFTRDWAVDLLNTVEPYGIVVTNGDNDTFPLWYAQEVEGVRQDVTVAVTSLLNTDWYVRQIIRRPPRPYDAAKGPAIYRDRAWPVPTVPPLSLTLEEADAVEPYTDLVNGATFVKDSISAVLRPGRYSRDQMLVLRMLKDSYPQRPMFFSSAGYAQQLGMGKYLIQEGILTKLNPVPPPVSPRYVPIQGFGAIDLVGSKMLWDSVYVGPKTLMRMDRWVDRASTDIPLRYVVTAAVLGEAMTQRGDSASGQKMMLQAQGLANAVRMNEVFGQGKRVE
jgi:hypothetical protein